SRRRHTRAKRDWSSDVCSSDLARERGVRRFIADVLPENRRMVNVFREAGYTAQQTFDEGVIRLTLDLQPTDYSKEVMQAREQRRSEERRVGKERRVRGDHCRGK